VSCGQRNRYKKVIQKTSPASTQNHSQFVPILQTMMTLLLTPSNHRLNDIKFTLYITECCTDSLLAQPLVSVALGTILQTHVTLSAIIMCSGTLNFAIFYLTATLQIVTVKVMPFFPLVLDG
jgi:hypothetical protein